MGFRCLDHSPFAIKLLDYVPVASRRQRSPRKLALHSFVVFVGNEVVVSHIAAFRQRGPARADRALRVAIQEPVQNVYDVDVVLHNQVPRKLLPAVPDANLLFVGGGTRAPLHVHGGSAALDEMRVRQPDRPDSPIGDELFAPSGRPAA